jgi:hypothetical protein
MKVGTGPQAVLMFDSEILEVLMLVLLMTALKLTLLP